MILSDIPGVLRNADDPESLISSITVSEARELIADGKLTPRVGEVYSLNDFAAAFGAITGRRAMGKVVMTMD